MQDLTSPKFDFQDLATVTFTQNCIVMFTRPISENMFNPKGFSISCTIDIYAFSKPLYDLEANINLKPLYIHKKLGIGKAWRTSMLTLLMVKRPSCILDDILVHVGRFAFPTDFVILDC